MPAPLSPPPAAPPSPGPSFPPRPPHVVLYTDDPAHGGVAQYNHAVLLGMAGRGWRVTCIQPPGRTPLIDAQLAAGVAHHAFPYDATAQFGRTLQDMETPRALFGRARPDLIVFSDGCPLSNFAARQAALALRIPFVVIVGFAAPYLARQFAPCLKVLACQYAKARAVVAVSEENLHLLRRDFGLSADAGEVIHYGRPASYFNPPDVATRERLRAELGIAQDAVLGLTAARLTEIKGHGYQLDALARLVETRAAPHLHLAWLGEGDQRTALTARLRETGLASRVSLLGHRWDMPAWYEAADFFVLPSQHEGMPLAIMEAMARRLPVIATAVSGIPEELGDTGRLLPDPKLAPAETVRALTEALREFAYEPALRRRLGDAAHARACALFREERMLERTLTLIAQHLPAHAVR